MIEFAPTDDGVRVRDDIENVSLDVATARDADPTPVADDPFLVPISAAVAVTTDAVRLPHLFNLYVRSGHGVVLDVPSGGAGSVGPGSYVVEVTTAPVKLYLRVEETALDVEVRDGRTVVSFDGPTRVVLGARSRHERPAGTVTTTAAPADVMRAVSTFGSALKTTSPERSFPTMRGHPPHVEQADAFSVPDHVAPPDTGVRVEVPRNRTAVYTVATLAYYLGAEVVPGAEPRLVAADAAVPLADDAGLAETVQGLLGHFFALDCVVRTEGLYRVDLHERDVLDRRVDVDFRELYDLDLAERTAAYLDVPRTATDDLVGWHLTADVDPAPRNVTILPYVVNDMAHIRSPANVAGGTAVEPEPEDVAEFFRGRPPSIRSTNADPGVDEVVVSPVPTDTPGHAWVAENFPMGASKPTVDSYRRRFDRVAQSDTTITVRVVCNDPEMREESENLYGFRDMLEFDVETHFDLSTAALRRLLAADVDFLHFIGHVTGDGMQCADGFLDLHTVPETNVDAFILNGCTSYEQGMQLVSAGALGGVVTLEDVYNVVATDVGRSLARLLDNGFDLFGALDVATENVATGHYYTIVGNAGVTLCQSNDGVPNVCEITRAGEGAFDVYYRTYPTTDFGLGSMFIPLVSEGRDHWLAGGRFGPIRVSERRLQQFFDVGRSPVLFEGELHWKDELAVENM